MPVEHKCRLKRAPLRRALSFLLLADQMPGWTGQYAAY